MSEGEDPLELDAPRAVVPGICTNIHSNIPYMQSYHSTELDSKVQDIPGWPDRFVRAKIKESDLVRLQDVCVLDLL
jgi:hypothetical protein